MSGQTGRNQDQQVYLKLNQITQVNEKDIFLKDVASVYCSDPALQNRCNALKIKTIRENKEKRYVEDALQVIEKISGLGSGIQVQNLGEADYIIDYRPPSPPHLVWQWIKTIFVCLVSFFGAAFAIMTFNNDVDVSQLFGDLYRMTTGNESDGFTVLEISYSAGLAIGILVFFNHFFKWKVSADPTPLEVEMRTYEEDICKTLIEDAGRKEREVDAR